MNTAEGSDGSGRGAVVGVLLGGLLFAAGVVSWWVAGRTSAGSAWLLLVGGRPVDVPWWATWFAVLGVVAATVARRAARRATRVLAAAAAVVAGLGLLGTAASGTLFAPDVTVTVLDPPGGERDSRWAVVQTTSWRGEWRTWRLFSGGPLVYAESLTLGPGADAAFENESFGAGTYRIETDDDGTHLVFQGDRYPLPWDEQVTPGAR